MKNYLKIIDIDDYSITHKYLQICNSILRAIERQEIVQDDVLPSINDLSTALEVSRNTIERAYKERRRGGLYPRQGLFYCQRKLQPADQGAAAVQQVEQS